MNQSKKLLAALVAVPASVVVADSALAAETTVTQTFEIKNEFIGNTTYKTEASTKTLTAATKQDLQNQILIELSNFNKGFTINYTDPSDVATYKNTIESVMTELKGELNQPAKTVTTTSDTATFDTTELYGVYNNMRVKATETKVGDTIVSVKLEFSVSYFGDKKELDAAKAIYKTDLESKVEAVTSDVAKIKIIHDHVVQHTRYVANGHRLAISSGLSSHGYALWMYTLLNQAFPNKIKYVYGVVNGEYRSWNIIEIDSKWYNIDASMNDTANRNDTLIKYYDFLTYKENTRRIISGADSIEVKDTKYNYFLTIDNRTQSDSTIYYANAESSGELYELNLSDLSSTRLNLEISEATSGPGRMVYYEQTSGDSATVVRKYLYFINDSQGKYLYRYELGGKTLELVLREQLASIELNDTTLNYIKLDGGNGFVPLSRVEDLDLQEATKVINAIKKLVTDFDKFTEENKPTKAFKDAVTAARALFMSLTKNQQDKVSNKVDLERIEKALGSSVKVGYVIDLINALNEMDKENYLKNIEAANKAYRDLPIADRELVYNYSILKTVLDKIKEAEALLAELNLKTKDSVAPFEDVPDFIEFIEKFVKKYDSYLPSIQKILTGTPEGASALATYRNQAIQLRNETQSFINMVKIIDDTSAKFLDEMAVIKVQYDGLLASQKFIISGADGAIVTNKVALAESMQTQITQFNEIMDKVNITSADIASLTITSELVADIKRAESIYYAMNASQKDRVSANVEKFTAILNRINSFTEDPDLLTIIKKITNLEISKMTSLDDLIQQVTSADTAIVTLARQKGIEEEEILSLLDASVVEKLKEYLNYRATAESPETIALRNEMDGLSGTSTKEQIAAARQKYEAFNRILQPLLKTELANLVAQEQRLTAESNAAIVAKLIADIALLTETSPLETIVTVKDRYDALTSALQATVTNSAHLLAIWAKVEAEAKAYQKAIDDVNKAIEALSETSTRAEIEAVDAKYGALNDDQKSKVINYDKIATLLAALELKEGAELDQLAAQKVIEMIATLTDESSKEEIEAIRTAYEALSDEAKALIPNSTLEILAYFESRLAEISEIAKAEAAVVVDRITRITPSYTEAQIKNIRIAFNALSALAKTYVTNLQKLIDAENNIIYQNTVVKQAKLDANAFDVYMNDINRNSTTAEIAKARAYYNRLSAEARKHVTTYEKLVRLETMWKDPEYLDLVFTYYPDYIHEVKPGAIVVQKPTYDPLYIPDDSSAPSTSPSVATNYPASASWSAYETMRYQNGRYTTTITSTQVKKIADRNMRLKADNIEIVVPTADLKASTATVGVSVNVSNNQLNIQFTEGNNAKYFSDYVEIHVPFSVLKGNASQIIERVSAFGSAASFKVDGSTFIIRTKSSGTFRAASASTYNDIPAGEQGNAIRELAKRGIKFDTTSRLSQSYKQVTKMDVALMIATALDLSSNAKSKYLDLESDLQVMRAQGLLEAGIMSGATSARFNPNGTITKQEAAIIIANMYRYLNQDLAKAYNNLNSSYRDVANLTLEARQSIAILELFGVVSGTGSFEPTKQLTRGEFAEIIYKALTAIDYL